MSKTKKELLVEYSHIYEKMGNSLSTFTFDTTEEKKLVMDLIKEKIGSLKYDIWYVEKWNETIDRNLKEKSDWKDIRL